jgi:hypothetical protein
VEYLASSSNMVHGGQVQPYRPIPDGLTDELQQFPLHLWCQLDRPCMASQSLEHILRTAASLVHLECIDLEHMYDLSCTTIHEHYKLIKLFHFSITHDTYVTPKKSLPTMPRSSRDVKQKCYIWLRCRIDTTTIHCNLRLEYAATVPPR